MRRRGLRLGCLAAALLSSGCLVQSQCHEDFDCGAGERCRSDGVCFVECRTHMDCWTGGKDNGKRCVQNRCEFRFDERVSALDFCLPVGNPASGLAGSTRCLSQLRGKVVLLYFGWLT